MNEHQEPSWADIKEMFAETDKKIKKTDQRFDKGIAELRLYLKEENSKLDKRFAETAAEMEKLNKHLGGISKSNGDMAEEYFFSAFRKDKIFMNEKYDRIQKGLFYSLECPKGEFDIVLFNGKSVVIIEVKYKARPENVNSDDLILRVERFKKYFPEYKHHKIYLAVAAMSFKKGLATICIKPALQPYIRLGRK